MRARFDDCVARITRAAGRELSDETMRKIFERIHKVALDIKAGREPVKLSGRAAKAMGLQAHEAPGMMVAMKEIAQRAAAEMVDEAERNSYRAHLQVVRLGARVADAARLEGEGIKPLAAIDLMIARDYSGRTNIESLEQRADGYVSELLRRLLPTWEALGGDFLGFFQNRGKMLDLIRELRGEDSGNALARQGAKAFHEVAESARKMFNHNGGAIGRLEDWGMPQHHSQDKVARAGKEAWVEFATELVDPARYVDEFTGLPWPVEQLRSFLGHAWDTIATDDNINIVPGQYRGTGSRAARHAEHRQIHFKSAEAAITYWESYGERTLVEILQGHIKTMARDIAFIEYFGPNPNLTYDTLRDAAVQRSAEQLSRSADPAERAQAGKPLEAQATHLDNLYNYAAGRALPVLRPWLRKTADAIAAANVFGKLGSAAITSFFGDKTMLEAVSHMNNLPVYQRWLTELSMLDPTNPAARRRLQREGLMLDAVRSGLQRFGDDLAQAGMPGRIANAVMRLTGMQAVNDFRKGGFAADLMAAIGHQLKRGVAFAELADGDIRTLRHMGVTEMDWKTWQLAQLEEIDLRYITVPDVLTPSAISRIPDQALRDAAIIGQAEDAGAAEAARRSAIVKLLGAVNTESEFAIVTPGWRERALFYGNLQRGSVPGEIWRSVLQFKSFPWAFFQRGMDAVANQETPASKATMAAYLLVATSLAGAMTMQTKEMLAGKDPRKMFGEDWYKFWGAAFVYGGALGFYGDFLYSVNQTRYGSGPIEALAGPTLGPLLELTLVQPLGAIRKLIEGEETKLLSQTVNDLKSFIPMNNAWYSKAVIDHLVWQQVLEAMNPGYLSAIRKRTLREYGQQWWWNPGETTPERLPAIEQAFER